MRRELPLALIALGWATATPAAPSPLEFTLARIAGSQGVVVVADGAGHTVIDVHGAQAFVPASTLKVLTALAVLRELGPDHRFETRFFVDGAGRLDVEGGGDPALTSEELGRIARDLAPLAPRGGFHGVLLDDSAFDTAIDVPGIEASTNPYDARNGALAVNFNTIQVRRVGDRIETGEPQTPLTPLARELARAHGVVGTERLNLGDDRERILRYVGELLSAFLAVHGARVEGDVVAGRVPRDARPLHVHRQSRPLSAVLADGLEYSSNFTMNQLLLIAGAHRSGRPATLQKGVALLAAEIERLGLTGELVAVEGSGISRANRATGRALLTVLGAFEPWRDLLPERDGFRYKTGTLRGVRTIAAYVEHPTRGRLRAVVSLPGTDDDARFDVLRRVRDAP